MVQTGLEIVQSVEIAELARHLGDIHHVQILKAWLQLQSCAVEYLEAPPAIPRLLDVVEIAFIRSDPDRYRTYVYIQI